jgi:hypothetical protein
MKKKKRKDNSGNDFILGIILLLIVLGYAVYNHLSNLPAEQYQDMQTTETDFYDEQYQDYLENPEKDSTNSEGKKIIQDPGVRYWDHMPLTYAFRDTGEFVSTCQDHIKERIKGAFDIIKNETNESVYFIEVNYTEEDYDIVIKCSNKVQTDGRAAEGISTAGEGGPTKLKGNLILKGELNIYPYRNCGTFPDVELHEIMHVLGFGHNDSSRLNLMYPYNLKCDGQFDESLSTELIRIYG